MTAAEPATRQSAPLQWSVNNLRLAGLSWGSPGEKPLLALHGWLDNAASFTALAPLLEGYHVVALDLTGHGQSDWRSADAGYQIWDDLPEILGVVDQLGWERFDLVGHSRGAIISMLLSASCPERVSRLVMLDALSPPPVPEADFPAQLRKALDDKPRMMERDKRIYPSIEEAASVRLEGNILPEAGLQLVRRNLCDCEGGVAWTTDPRLRGASAVKLTQGQVAACLGALAMPTLLLIASASGRGIPQVAEQARQYIKDLVIETVTGGHDFHMEQEVPALAARVLDFLAGGQP